MLKSGLSVSPNRSRVETRGRFGASRRSSARFVRKVPWTAGERGRLLAAAVVAAAVVLPVPASAAQSTRTYIRERAGATWVLPAQASGRVVVYEVTAVRYVEAGTGETIARAQVSRTRCRVVRGGGRSCGAPAFEVLATPRVFDVADDLSAASLEIVADGATFNTSWTAYEPFGSPDEFVPLAEEYEESCPEGSGLGRGLYRRMNVSAQLFGKSLRSRPGAEVNAWADRIVLATDCPPEHTPL